MDNPSIILIVFIFLFLAIKLLGYLSRLGIKQITVRELEQKKGVLLLDVRTPKEFDQGHLAGAINVPLSDMGERLKKIKKEKEIVVYCQSGNRSIWAIKRLMGMGFKSVYDLKGGYNAWRRLHR